MWVKLVMAFLVDLPCGNRNRADIFRFLDTLQDRSQYAALLPHQCKSASSGYLVGAEYAPAYYKCIGVSVSVRVMRGFA
jgi:hypothetical protein